MPLFIWGHRIDKHIHTKGLINLKMCIFLDCVKNTVPRENPHVCRENMQTFNTKPLLTIETKNLLAAKEIFSSDMTKCIFPLYALLFKLCWSDLTCSLFPLCLSIFLTGILINQCMFDLRHLFPIGSYLTLGGLSLDWLKFNKD